MFDTALCVVVVLVQAGVAVEIWTMTAGLFFDNVVVGNSEEDAAAFAAATWSPRYTAQVDRDEQVRARIARQQREEVRVGCV